MTTQPSHSPDDAATARGLLVTADLEGVGEIELVAVPETSLELHVAVGPLDGTTYPVTLRGPVRGLPDGTPCEVRVWVVSHANGSVRAEQIETLPLAVRGGEAELALRFDVLARRVFEPSDAHFRVRPLFPFAEDVVAQGKLPLPHALRIEITPGLRARVGDVVTFTPRPDVLFDRCARRLQIFEVDDGERGASASALDWSAEETDAAVESRVDGYSRAVVTSKALEWPPGEHGPIRWRVGCTATRGEPVLTYPEPDEAGGGYELGLRVTLSVNGWSTEVAGPVLPDRLGVPRPALTDFRLMTDPPDLFALVREGSWRSRLHVLGHTATIRARGSVAHVGEHLRLPLELDLWRFAPVPLSATEGAAECAVEPLLPAPVVAACGPDGHFEAVLHAFDAFTDPRDVRGFVDCFAVLRVPPSVTATHGAYLQVRQVMDFDEEQFAPLFDPVLRAGRPDGGESARLRHPPRSPGDVATAIASEDLPRGVHLLDNRPEDCPRCREDVTADQLRGLFPGVAAAKLQDMATAFNALAGYFDLDRCLRKAHFFAQVREEVGPACRLEEDLHYSAARLGETFAYFRDNPGEAAACAGKPEAIASRVYSEGGEDNGWRYRGRGYMHLTRKSNYRSAQVEIDRRYPGSGLSLVDVPDQLLEPRGAMCSAMAFWSMQGLNAAADRGATDAAVEAVTDVINRHTASRKERRDHFRAMRDAFQVDQCLSPGAAGR